MALQMIFCVETNKRADTDSIYISETLNSLYVIDNKVKITKVYLEKKSKYNAKDVLREIESKIKAFTIGETRVIYCIDTDAYETNYEHKKELDDIARFCKDKGYELVWFCHNVEEVYLGNKVSDSQKVSEAATFRRKKAIEKIHIDTLSSSTMRKGTSNILKILDKYLKRKK